MSLREAVSHFYKTGAKGNFWLKCHQCIKATVLPVGHFVVCCPSLLVP